MGRVDKVARLGDLTTLISSGSTPKGGSEVYLSEGPVMLIRSQNVRMNQLALDDVAYVTQEIDAGMNRSRVHYGDVLLNITGASIGRVATFELNDVKANVNQHVCIIRPKPGALLNRYVTHLISSNEFQATIGGLQNGGTRQALTFGQIAEFKIPLPPLAEQRRIADVLDRAEALRAKRRAALAQLDSLTQSIFIEMFGDPVTNERGWPLASISDFVAGFESGKSVVADDVDDVSCPYRVLKVSSVTSLEYLPYESKALPFDYKPPSSHFVHKGDLLFSRANTSELIGATALVHETPPNILMPDKLWRFVWHDVSRAKPRYVLYLFRQPKFRSEIGKRATGTSGSMKNISQDKVLSIRVGHPPLSLQQEFSRRISAIEKLKAAQRTSLAQLDALFASLQHRAFRGEL